MRFKFFSRKIGGLMRGMEYLYRIFAIAMVVIWAGGCSGGESGSATNAETPIIKMDKQVNVNEEGSIDIEFLLEGLGPFYYSLVESPDKDFFSIDSRGHISSNYALDFESPTDSDKNNIYIIKVEVKDELGWSDIQKIAIEVVDTADYKLEVDFPPARSNVGGNADTFRIRGHVTLDGEKLEYLPEGIHINHGDSVASPSVESPSDWLLEIELQPTMTAYELNLSIDGETKNKLNWWLDNSMVARTSDAVFIDPNKMYSVSAGNLGVVKYIASNQSYEPILTIYGREEELGCQVIESIRILGDGNNLILNCAYLVDNKIDKTNLIYDISNQVFIKLPDHLVSTRDCWTLVKDMLFSCDGQSIKGYDLISKERIKIEFTLDEGRVAEIKKVESFGSKVVVNALNPYVENSRYFIKEINLEELDGFDRDSQNGVSFIYVSLLGAETNLIVGGDYHTNNESILYELDEKFYSSPISTLYESNDDVEVDLSTGLNSSDGDLELVNLSDEYVFVKKANSGSVWGVSLDDSSIQSYEFIPPGLIRYYSQLEMSPNGKEAMLASVYHQSLFKLDFEDLKVEKSYGLESGLKPYNSDYLTFDVDWVQDKAYLSLVVWDNYSSPNTPKLLEVDLRSGLGVVLASKSEMAEVLDAGINFVVGPVIKVPDQNTLWFSVFSVSGIKRSIFSLDIETKNILNIYSDREGSFGSTPLLSDYNEGLSGAVFGQASGGYLRLLRGDGAFTEYFNSDLSYHDTGHPVIDESMEKVFFTTIDKTENIYVGNFTDVNLVEYSLVEDSFNVIASYSKGYGLPISRSAKFNILENSGLFVDFYEGHIMYLDPKSGDRVLLPISAE